jgi:hypothetical protein
VIPLTGHPMDKELEALSDLGLADWMTKPPVSNAWPSPSRHSSEHDANKWNKDDTHRTGEYGFSATRLRTPARLLRASLAGRGPLHP